MPELETTTPDLPEIKTCEEYFKRYTIDAIEWRAARLLKDVDSPFVKGEKVEIISRTIAKIANESARDEYARKLSKIYALDLRGFKRQIQKFIDEKEKKPKAKLRESDDWVFIVINYKNEALNISDKLDEHQRKSIQQYGFIEWKNAYYFGELDHEQKNARLYQRSNFGLRILYHIKRNKNKNKRVVAIYNERGKSEVIDIETKQLTSLQAFKEFTEGAGYFLFKGTNDDLTKLKQKLMEEEKPCVQLDTLGWYKKGFFAFSNGIIRENKFVPVDEFGIVEFDDLNYFIPYHPGTEDTANVNEKRFSWKPSEVTWHEWSGLYHNVFGAAGMVMMMFGCATIFSDHIFFIKGNFPILFLYGEGGSGKSKMIQFIQYWFGDPQPGLKVSEKANTDKGKIRKMAQFSNSIALFEEYVNTMDISVIKTFTGFYDRYGYERADIDSKYGTETVPVLSTVAFTGNEYPQDDPFLQRMILIDHNVNEFSEEQQKLFDKLNKMNRKGLTHIIQYLLRSRKLFEETWETEYEKHLQEFKVMCFDLKVPSRMLENNAVLLATYTTLTSCGIEFPFSIDALSDFLLKTLRTQSEKRDVGGALQRFWDIVLHLHITKKIDNRHLELNGNELMIRISEVHGMYVQEHYNMFRQPGLNKSTLMQKLKDSPSFIEFNKSYRFNKEINTSCFVFEVTRLNVDFSYWMHGISSGERNENANPGVDTSGKQISMNLKSFIEPKKDDDDVPDWVKG